MGTPHVHCMSKLPTAHEPEQRAAARSADRDSSGARTRGAAQIGGVQGHDSSVTAIQRAGSSR